MNTRITILLVAISAMGLAVTGCSRKEAEQARKDLQAVETELVKVKTDAETVRKSLEDAQGRIKSLSKKLQSARQATRETKHQLQDAQAKSEKDLQSKSAVEADLLTAKKEIDTLKQTVTRLEKAKTIAETESVSSQRLAENLRRRCQTLESELARMKKQESSASASRTENPQGAPPIPDSPKQ